VNEKVVDMAQHRKIRPIAALKAAPTGIRIVDGDGTQSMLNPSVLVACDNCGFIAVAEEREPGEKNYRCLACGSPVRD
jgi:DNA-directed RNA polymerase subunit RPC12/RpoP